MNYYIEKLKPIDVDETDEVYIYTFHWVSASELLFDTVTQARDHIDASMNPRINYRITNGEQVWQI